MQVSVSEQSDGDVTVKKESKSLAERFAFMRRTSEPRRVQGEAKKEQVEVSAEETVIPITAEKEEKKNPFGAFKDAVLKQSGEIQGGMMAKLDTMKDTRDAKKAEKKEAQALSVEQKKEAEAAEAVKLEQKKEKKRQKAVQKELIKPQVAHEKKTYFTSLLTSLGKEDDPEPQGVQGKVESSKAETSVEEEVILTTKEVSEEVEKQIEAKVQAAVEADAQDEPQVEHQEQVVEEAPEPVVEEIPEPVMAIKEEVKQAPVVEEEPAVDPVRMKVTSIREESSKAHGIIARRKERRMAPVQAVPEVDDENMRRTQQLLRQEEQALLDAIMRTPKDIRLYKRLGLVYQELGNDRDAHQCFREALKRGSQDPEVRRALAHVNVAA